AEIILRNYSDYFESFIILRPFFIYGPKQNINMLIPQLIKKVYYNEEITIEGKKGIKINPIYIEDAALATMKTINLKGKHIINIAGNEILNLKEIILNIAKILNKKPRIKTVESKKISLIADITEMRQKLHTPQTNFQEGLEKTIDFYKKIL
ncbi:MAG: NAD(P)-dependent oxidoreductase, partial [Candidatus Calescibacterium sp.]|nr:NAD(P)-dependent oxidoreductase [Candidatus Calescibacterium sp.]MDW8132547.1 NAD(P)-dependent oxidoreductase [Candidatus Calescibacterium sp.]